MPVVFLWVLYISSILTASQALLKLYSVEQSFRGDIVDNGGEALVEFVALRFISVDEATMG